MTPADAHRLAVERIEEARRAGAWLLDLGDLPLGTLPEELGTLTELRVLALGKWAATQREGKVEWEWRGGRPTQQFTDLSPLRSLTALTSLDLGDCAQVNDLSPLQSLTTLASLCLSGCAQVSDLSPLRSLTALTALDLSGCAQVSDLSPLRSLTALAKLTLQSCSQVSDLSPLQFLTALTSLDLSGCRQVRDLSPLRNLTALAWLDLDDCVLVSDLSPLQSLSALASLTLQSCSQVSDLSPLQSLSALASLDLSWCEQVNDLSPLRSLSALTSLNLGGCAQVNDLSPLQSLSALTSLNLGGCHQVRDLSPLQRLSALAWLKLSGCRQVSDLSPLQSLPALASLKLRFCGHLGSFAPVVRLLPHLGNLYLHGSTFDDLPNALTGEWDENVLPKVRAHFADLALGSTDDTEAKLFLLGNGRVGKTQAARRLCGLEPDFSRPSTHGVELGRFNVTLNAKPIRVNIWDFGGQDIYHGTHALFLDRHAVFLVLWNPASEQGNADEGNLPIRHRPLGYWLDYLRSIDATSSPVLIIQSQCDEPRHRVKPPEVETGDFRCLKFLEFSALTDLGLDVLLGQIKEAVRELVAAHPLNKIGIGRAKVRDTVRGMIPTTKTLSVEEFHALCAATGGVTDADALLDYLDKTSVLFYRPGLFQGRIILDQNWATTAIYTLFDRQKTAPYLFNDGKFTRAMLADQVWQQYPEAEQRTFLSMMESCGICFRLRQLSRSPQPEEWEYLAPDFLPSWNAVQPQLRGRLPTAPPDDSATVRFVLLHEGIARTLLSRIGQEARDAAVYWKYGCWFFEETTRSKMLLRAHGNEITLQAWGAKADKLIDRVLRTMQQIPCGKPPEVIRSDRAHRLPDDPRTEKGVEEMKVGPLGSAPGHNSRRVYLSYAWGDNSPAGQQRDQLIEDLCRHATTWGYEIQRDKECMSLGQLISGFMKQIAQGDRVIIVLSEKYLRSVYCMTELFEVFMHSRGQKDDFLRRIVPLTMDDARIGRTLEQVAHARFWKMEHDELQQVAAEDLSLLGMTGACELIKMKLWAAQVKDILAHINDTLHPVGFDAIAGDDFAGVRHLLERA